MEFEAPIAAVTVHTDSARVVRRGTVRLARGFHEVELGSLPTVLRDDSVRVTGRGAHAVIASVDVGTELRARPAEDQLARLEEQLVKLREQVRALADREDAAVERVEFLRGLSRAGSERWARAIALGAAEIEAAREFSETVLRELEVAQATRRGSASEKEDAERELEVARRRLEREAPSAPTTRRAVTIGIDCAEDTDIELTIDYLVDAASWQPTYDVRLVDDRLTIDYLALVRQSTGEDWSEVPLELSTATPSRRVTIPELTPWYVGGYSPRAYAAPQMPSGTPPMPMAAPMAAAPAPEPARVAPQDIEIEEAAVERTGASMTFGVARPATVRADGTPHRASITSLDLDPEIDYVTIPKLNAEAYLRASVTNTSGVTLLPGPARIFHGDSFVGSTELDTVPPGGEWEMQLGVDDRIEVERKTVRFEKSKALIGGTRRTAIAFEIEITSRLPSPATITVIDQLPLSASEYIKVKDERMKPEPKERSDMNIVEWQVSVEPGESKTIELSFSLEQGR